MENLLVMKFGGTSMGSAERIRTAADLAAREKQHRPVLVVVSAMSKVTDLLLDAMRHAEAGDRAGLDAHLQTLQDRHLETLRELLPADKQEAAHGGVLSLVADFQRLAQGMLMLNERPARAADEAVSIGERLSALLISAYLESEGIRSLAINAATVIVTDALFGNASPLMEPTREKARRDLLPWLESGVLPVVTGFNGATADGRPTTLGRGGSDFSASILAAVLDAAEVWIWTDVDGIMTADPRLVPEAKVLPEVTYNEAAELAYNGAKVLHPRTLAPLIEREIPVWSKNSFAPEKPGTKIVSHLNGRRGARAVTSTASVALIALEPSAAVVGARLMARALDALGRANIEILALTSSSFRQSFCFLVRQGELSAALESLEAALSLEFAHGYLKPVEVDEDVGLLAVAGEGMRGETGIAGRLFTAISREQVNIIAIAQGSSELTISIVVRRDGLEKAVRAVHGECRLGEE
ncbi:MAG: aspartate kinase [Bryobacterales bacterium]|nr:aspartate kinase [Bryobacterales bacterium]